MDQLTPFEQYIVPKDTAVDEALIKKAIKWNEDQNLKRLDLLDNYYLGNHEILDRTTSSGTNNKIVVNHAKYITDTNIGYLLGNPVDYTVSDDGKFVIDPVTDAYKDQTINDLDTEIAKDVSIFGYQYEYIYSDEEAQPRSMNIDNRHVVLVRDDTMAHRKIAAIIYRPKYDEKGKLNGYHLIVADTINVTEYSANKDGGSLKIAEAARAHAFGDVPVIEYKNNPEYQGDFQQVIPLIDAYNLLQSDRVNDKEQLVDAILAFYGMDFDADQAIALKEGRMIANIPTNGKVEFLTKQLNEADTDVLRKVIESDIHKISMTPNMTDENFVGNSSGVAIRYKLLAFEQNVKNKERYFERGLMERFELYNHFLNVRSNMPLIATKELDAVFKRNLPTNDLETSQMINNLNGIVDRATLIGQLSFVKNAQETLDKVDAEEADNADLDDIAAADNLPNANDDLEDEDLNTPPTPTPAADEE